MPVERPVVPDRPQWAWATVTARQEMTPVVVSLSLSFDKPLPFLAGQYCNLRVPVPYRPRPIQRAYSIASSPLPVTDTIEVLVSRVDDGLVSPLLHHLQVGERIEVRAPHGNFTFRDSRGPSLFIGAGTGVAPFLSMTRALLVQRLPVEQTVLLSSRDWAHAVGRNELAELAKQSEHVRVFHTFTRDDADPRARFHRRIDAVMLRDVGALEAETVYICGWPDMVETTLLELEAVGVPSSKIATEKYN